MARWPSWPEPGSGLSAAAADVQVTVASVPVSKVSTSPTVRSRAVGSGSGAYVTAMATDTAGNSSALANGQSTEFAAITGLPAEAVEKHWRGITSDAAEGK